MEWKKKKFYRDNTLPKAVNTLISTDPTCTNVSCGKKVKVTEEIKSAECMGCKRKMTVGECFDEFQGNINVKNIVKVFL